MKNLLLSFIGWVLLKSARLFFRLPDFLIVTFFSILELFFLLVDKEHPGLLSVRDFKDVIRNFPEGNRIIKRFFIECRDQQAIDLFKGALKHHLTAESHPFAEYDIKPLNRRLGKGVTIGFIGSHYDFDYLAKAYQSQYQCNLQEIDVTNSPVLTGINGLEIAVLSPPVLEFLRQASLKQIALSIHHSAIQSRDMLKEILSLTHKSHSPFRILYSYFYYPPVIKIKDLIRKGEIGDVTTIRIRATMGKTTEADSGIQITPQSYLSHPAFDHFPLLTFLGGEIEKVSSYLNPMDQTAGGQGLVNCKYLSPGRYGILECSLAPELHFISDHLPYNLEIEIAGSDGIIWLQRGMATRTRSAPIAVRVGQKFYSIGVESGFPSHWDSVYHNMAGEFLNMVHRKPASSMQENHWINAYNSKDLAYTSNTEKKVVCNF